MWEGGEGGRDRTEKETSDGLERQRDTFMQTICTPLQPQSVVERHGWVYLGQQGWQRTGRRSKARQRTRGSFTLLGLAPAAREDLCSIAKPQLALEDAMASVVAVNPYTVLSASFSEHRYRMKLTEELRQGIAKA